MTFVQLKPKSHKLKKNKAGLKFFFLKFAFIVVFSFKLSLGYMAQMNIYTQSDLFEKIYFKFKKKKSLMDAMYYDHFEWADYLRYHCNNISIV